MGSYEPVEVAGTYAGSVVAFIRQLEDTFVIVVAPRLVMKLLDGAEIPLPVRWEDTSITLPHAEIIDIFTEEHHTVPEDGKLRLSELLRNFPVSALFSRTSA
jgi:maltooligosyltrehalose synthase